MKAVSKRIIIVAKIVISRERYRKLCLMHETVISFEDDLRHKKKILDSLSGDYECIDKRIVFNIDSFYL